MTEARVPVTDDALVEKVARAMANAVIRDDEGDFPRLFDLLDFSGENKAWTITYGLTRAAIAIAYPAGVAAGREEAAKVCDDLATTAASIQAALELVGSEAPTKAIQRETAETLAAAIRERGK